jgi:hypothetical protein
LIGGFLLLGFQVCLDVIRVLPALVLFPLLNRGGQLHLINTHCSDCFHEVVIGCHVERGSRGGCVEVREQHLVGGSRDRSGTATEY